MRRKAPQRSRSSFLAFSRRQILQRILDLNDVVRSVEPLLKRLGEDVNLQTRLSPSLAHVMLAVSDTGRGMDVQTRERIFEPFFTAKQRGENTGLGLATVYGIVKQSGGSIWVYSEPGQGATFKVYLPATTQDVTQPAAAPAPKRVEGTETILVAENQAEVRSIATTILSRHGYNVLEATDGEEALRILRDQPDRIHLLLTDVVMPSIGGPELVRRLRETHPSIRVPNALPTKVREVLS